MNFTASRKCAHMYKLHCCTTKSGTRVKGKFVLKHFDLWIEGNHILYTSPTVQVLYLNLQASVALIFPFCWKYEPQLCFQYGKSSPFVKKKKMIRFKLFREENVCVCVCVCLCFFKVDWNLVIPLLIQFLAKCSVRSVFVKCWL